MLVLLVMGAVVCNSAIPQTDLPETPYNEVDTPVDAGSAQPDSKLDSIFPNLKVHIADKRVAQLLLVLHELDEWVSVSEGLQETELSELISKAYWRVVL